MRATSRTRRLLPTIAWMALIFALSSKSHFSAPGGFSVDAMAIVAHLFLYGALAGLLLFGLHDTGASRLRTVLIVIALTTLYGVSDELHQSFVPQRDASLSDVAVDFSAALIMVGALALLQTTRTRWRAS